MPDKAGKLLNGEVIFFIYNDQIIGTYTR